MTTDNTGYMLTMGESLLALAIILAILLALADTPLYPAAFGAVAIAALYELLQHPDVIPTQWVKWAGNKLH